jgi:hypothetical protein
MNMFKPLPKLTPIHTQGSDFAADHRARLALAESEKQERRRSDRAEQMSDANTPEQRIRIWERVHQIALPREVDHPLVRLIAERTGLTVAEVGAEQARRGPVVSRRSPKRNLSWNSGAVR